MIAQHLMRVMMGQQSAAGPAPPVAGVGMWYDATVSSSITDAGAGAVSQWNDLSGNGHNLTQVGGGTQPTTGARTINSLNVLDFDGNDYMISSTGLNATAFTIFIIMQQDGTAASSQGLLTLTNTQTAHDLNGLMVELRTNKYALDWGEGSSSASAGDFVAQHQTSGTANTNAHMLRIAADTSARTHHVDGTATTLTNFASSGTTTFMSGLGSDSLLIRIGVRTSVTFPYNGAVGEVLVYASVLSGGDITTVENYLRAKWGTP